MIILGIESSCDETAASIAKGNGENVEILSNIISSQIDIHRQYGGVVPEIAAREHVLNILPVINQALKEAGIKKEEVSDKIDAITIANGPGLMTSLITGLETAKALSYVWNIPIIGINHVESHIYANFIKEAGITPEINFPALCLTVSGGHTMLILMKNHGEFEIIGETRDDAAGEAFDKGAKLMSIGYPGGPVVSKYAKEFEKENKLEDKVIKLPRPMMHSGDFDFSFSGLKTALLYQIKADKDWQNKIPEYCHEYQSAITDVLIHKTIKAAEKYNIKTVMLSGGVSANQKLRQDLKQAVKEKLPNSNFTLPDLKYTTDNAAMVASAGYFKARSGKFSDYKTIKANPNLEIC